VINLSPTGAYINGNVATNNTPVQGSTGQVSGSVTQDFYQDLPNPPDPAKVSSAWTSFSSSTSTMATGTAASPARYKISGSGNLNLSGSSTLTITAPASGEGYAEIWVPGDLTLTGNAAIVMPAHVHATFYVDGTVKAAGNGIQNTSQAPVNLTLYGNHDPAANQSITVDGNGQWAGVIYAPNSTVSVKGGGSSGDMWGSITGDTIYFTGGTSLHYDAALGDNGAVIDYRVASWYEDNTLTR
jgi:hypothetical protein